MSTNGRTHPLIPIAGSLILLTSLYVGAYFAMVQQAFMTGARFPVYGGRDWDRYAFDDSQKYWKFFFAPVHSVDRRVRSEFWH